MKRPLPLLTTQTRHTSQDGSILISLAGALLLLMVLLGSIQIGYAYYQERELQKTADLAALSGVQVLSAGDCDAAYKRAFEIAKGNDPDLNSGEFESTCGRWDATQGTQPFVIDATPLNAVRTTIKRRIPVLIPFITEQTVRVHATALSTEPVAAFSVGSRLLRLDSTGLVAAILKGAGLDPQQLKVLDAAGIVNIDITPSGLLQALDLPPTVLAGIGTPDQLTRVTQLDLADLLTVSFDLVKHSTATQDHIDAARELLTLVQGLSPLNIPISLVGEHGILATVDAATLDSALNTHLNLMDILSSSIVLANGENLARITLPILGDAVDAAIQIVEPPTLAVGGVGAKAYNAQVRAYLRIKTSALPIVGLILPILSTSIDLPISIDIASSTGTLGTVCKAPNRSQAAIFVDSEITNICIGGPAIDATNMNSTDFNNAFNACKTGATDPHTLIKLIALPILKGPIEFRLLAHDNATANLTAPPSDKNIATVPNPSNIKLELVTNLAEKVLNPLGLPLVANLAGQVLSILTSVLNPILNDLLNTLGLNLGETDVTLHSVQCGVPRLVE